MCINHNVSSVDYTYENDCSEARSVIDHFILSENLNEEITLYCSLHEGDNTSDHNPVLLHLSVRIEHMPSDHPPTTSQNRVSWHRASSRDILAYKEMLSVCLEGIMFLAKLYIVLIVLTLIMIVSFILTQSTNIMTIL
jgi:hypothetical protein